MILKYFVNCVFINENVCKRLFFYLVDCIFKFTLFAFYQKRSQFVSIIIDEFDLDNQNDFGFNRNKTKKFDFVFKKIK